VNVLDRILRCYIAKQPSSGLKLKDVAPSFTELQQKRETADYDNSLQWTSVNAESSLDKASLAFLHWREDSRLPRIAR